MALSFVVTGTVWAWILNPTKGINVLLDAVGISAVREALLDIARPPAAVGRCSTRCASTCSVRA